MLDSFDRGSLAVVIGASGGIGAALARAVEDSGRFTVVIGVGRTTTPRIELTDEASIAALAKHLRTPLPRRNPAGSDAPTAPLRLVIDATGFLHDVEFAPEKNWRALDPAYFARSFAVNATGPALLMKHLLPLFPRQGKAVFATLSAKVGSIGDNRIGGWYAYRASKAALNQIVRCAAIELARTRPEAACVALHPGTVDTALSAPFAKTGLTTRTPEVTAADLIAVLDRIGPTQSGSQISYTGEVLPP